VRSSSLQFSGLISNRKPQCPSSTTIFCFPPSSASRLYHTFAKDEPILDYHNHLPPKDIAQDRQFKNLFEIWLEGDHYKWRAMRCNGVPEELITGDATPL
jgi:glucuronate isomerase